MSFKILCARATGRGPEFNQLVIYFNSKSSDASIFRIWEPSSFSYKNLGKLLQSHSLTAYRTRRAGHADELYIEGITVKNFDALVNALKKAGFNDSDVDKHVIPLADVILNPRRDASFGASR